MHGGMLLIPKEQAQAKYAASVFLFNNKNGVERKYYLWCIKWNKSEILKVSWKYYDSIAEKLHLIASLVRVEQ